MAVAPMGSFMLGTAPPLSGASSATSTPAAADVVAAIARPVDTATTLYHHLRDWALEKGPGIVAALLMMLAAWVLAGWARRLILNALLRAHFDLTLSKFFANLSKWSILAFAVVACLGTFGVNTTSFAAVFGAAGLAVGLALQGNLGNLASGVLILVFRPFKIGDSVIVAGQAGVVDGIDMFTTNLDTPDNRRIIVPNGSIFGGVIENQTRHPKRRVDVAIPVAGTIGLDDAEGIFRGVVEEVCRATPGALSEPAPNVVLDSVNPVTWTIHIWADTPRFGAVKVALLRGVKAAVDANRLAPPGPNMDVRITSMPGK
ncbi:MAG: mechanosensitive ion channel [Phycisphaerae bacterium]|nr:mechanosensitive ion channel [Phycisphaerae bacterium]